MKIFKGSIEEIKSILTSHYGMYVIYMTKKSQRKEFDYDKWSKPTIVNWKFIDGLSEIKGLIKVKVYFTEPIILLTIKNYTL